MGHTIKVMCTECKKEKEVLVPAGALSLTICYDCEKEKKGKEYEEYFKKLDNMPCEKRIRRIEEWIYNYEHTYHTPTELLRF